MPRYEYRCPTCDERFELQRPMAESSAPATCPAGHPGARRLLSVFATSSSATAATGGAAPAPPCGGACACRH